MFRMSSGKSLSWRNRSGWVLALAAAALLAGAAAALLFAHRGPSGSQAAEVLKVGNQVGGTRALMEAAGVLKDAPYRIEWSLFPAASPLLEALAAGAIDAGGVGDAPFAFAYASGAKIRVVQAYEAITDGKASAIVVPPASPLQTVFDLKGRKVATVRGSAGQDLVLRVLEHQGLPLDAVKFVYLSNGDAKAALATGAVDAWSTWASYVGIAVLHDHDRSLVDAAGLKPGVLFMAANDSAIAAKHALLADFMHRLTLAYVWAAQHPQAHAAALARETGVPMDVAQFTVRPIYRPTLLGPQLARDEQEVFERYRRAGVIAQTPDLSGAFDPSFNAAGQR
jgi:sulfonate transport system substrate-binding protein